jgi:hypothetical protein
VLVASPSAQYEAAYETNHSRHPKKRIQPGRQSELRVERDQHEGEPKQGESKLESSPISLHEVRVNTFC